MTDKPGKPDKPNLRLTPPPRDATETADTGARELCNSSESDDHFSDAQSAPPSATSPIPRTRVEKVSDEPSYGEVPGTEAYRMREGDAEPDEIAVIPDEVEKEKQRIRAASIVRPSAPGGQPIPKTVLEEAEDVPGRPHQSPVKRHRADSRPDLIVRTDGSVETGESSEAGGNESYTTPTPFCPDLKPSEDNAVFSPRSPGAVSAAGDAGDHEDGFNDDDGCGDDFDDFEEGTQDAEFADFEDGFEGVFADPPAVETSPAPPPPAAQPSVTAIPTPNLDDIDLNEVFSRTEPYISALFPPTGAKPLPLPPLSIDSSVFLSSRSASLWSQLVTPPPLQPPDWIRSRIRRAFLVSLGVPVDLDEILPASKQKKLILPSVGTPRGSFEIRSAARLKNSEANASSTSVDSYGKPKDSGSSNRRKKGPAEPQLDLVSGKQLCTTTGAALDNMTDQELREHLKKLEALRSLADEALSYWKKKTDEKIGDREAFEGVIENLVKHARKVRK